MAVHASPARATVRQPRARRRLAASRRCASGLAAAGRKNTSLAVDARGVPHLSYAARYSTPSGPTIRSGARRAGRATGPSLRRAAGSHSASSARSRSAIATAGTHASARTTRGRAIWPPSNGRVLQSGSDCRTSAGRTSMTSRRISAPDSSRSWASGPSVRRDARIARARLSDVQIDQQKSLARMATNQILASENPD